VANVWVVTEGEYSDYRVVGVFSTKENAQVVWDAIHATGARYLNDGPVLWTLDPGLSELRVGLRCYKVRMLRDGTVESCKLERLDIDGAEGARPEEVKIVRRSGWRKEYPHLDWTGDEPKADFLDWFGWAKDEQGAVKATNEHRARLIANNEW
jgi:hypothetical protein